MSKPTLIVVTLLMLAVAGTLGVMLGTSQPQHADIPPTIAGADIGGELTLKTHTGAVFNQSDYEGQHFLVFFGFANCPGICPMELDKMNIALNDLDPALEKQVQPIFITLDPERDTNEMLGDFIGDYHPRLLALTGTQEEVNAVSEQWRVYAEFMTPEEDGSYMINHSTYTYLMDPEMKPLDIFKIEDTPKTMTTRLQVRLGEQG